MKRLSLLLAAAAGLLGSSGCTHCDTCATFPIPCVGGNCGGSDGYLSAPASGYTGSGMVVGQVSSTVPTAPQGASTSPFAAQAELTPATSTEARPSTVPVPRSVVAAAPRTDVKAPASIPMPTPRSRADDSASSPPLPLGPEGAPGAGS